MALPKDCCRDHRACIHDLHSLTFRPVPRGTVYFFSQHALCDCHAGIHEYSMHQSAVTDACGSLSQRALSASTVQLAAGAGNMYIVCTSIIIVMKMHALPVTMAVSDRLSG